MNPFEYIKQRITDIADVNVAINGRDLSWGYADLMELLANIEEAYNDRYGSSDTISRQAAIDALSLGKEMLSRVLDDMDVVGTEREKYSWGLKLIESNIEDMKELSSAQPEPLTDKEQRIFLAAMSREEKVCEKVDKSLIREPYEDSLTQVCKEIIRKVKGALWT